jgi:hypothetical protein
MMFRNIYNYANWSSKIFEQSSDSDKLNNENIQYSTQIGNRKIIFILNIKIDKETKKQVLSGLNIQLGKNIYFFRRSEIDGDYKLPNEKEMIFIEDASSVKPEYENKESTVGAWNKFKKLASDKGIEIKLDQYLKDFMEGKPYRSTNKSIQTRAQGNLKGIIAKSGNHTFEFAKYDLKNIDNGNIVKRLSQHVKVVDESGQKIGYTILNSKMLNLDDVKNSSEFTMETLKPKDEKDRAKLREIIGDKINDPNFWKSLGEDLYNKLG